MSGGDFFPANELVHRKGRELLPRISNSNVRRNFAESCFCVRGSCSNFWYECHVTADCDKFKKCRGPNDRPQCRCDTSNLSLFFSFNLSVPSLLLRQAQNSRAGQPMVFCARNAGCSLWKSGGFFCSAEGLPGCHFNLRKMCNFIRSKSFSLFGHKKAQFTRNGSKF